MEVKILTNEETRQNKGRFLFSGRLVPIKQEGNIVYARSLRIGEEDTGEVVNVPAGCELVIPAGELAVNLRQIDDQYSLKGLGGYAPMSGTVWTWFHLARLPQNVQLFIISLAQRTDAAHLLCTSALEARSRARVEEGIPELLDFFNALAIAGMSIIALHRSISMTYSLVKKVCPSLKAPNSINKICKPVEEIRNAFEHIDDRAEGKIGKSKEDPEQALTIFTQPDFIKSSIIRYRGYELNLESEAIPALLDSRELIMNAIGTTASDVKPNKG